MSLGKGVSTRWKDFIAQDWNPVSECFHAIEFGSGDDIFASFSDMQNVCMCYIYL